MCTFDREFARTMFRQLGSVGEILWSFNGNMSISNIDNKAVVQMV